MKSAAGLAVTSCTGRAIGDSPTTRNPLSFGTYGLPGYSVEDAINLVAATGFDSIEIAAMPGYHGAPDQLSPKARKKVHNHLTTSGLRLGAIMGLPLPKSGHQRENLDAIDQLLELALDLSPNSPPLIQGVLGGGKWEEKKALFLDELGPWIERAKAAGVRLAIKPHRAHAMSLPDQGIWLINQLNAAETLRLVYDQSHFAYRDLPLVETIARALPYTSHIVMKDAVLLDDKVHYKLPGQAGSIPHTEVLRHFIGGGYRGELCAEVSKQVWSKADYDAAETTRVCFNNLRSTVDDLKESEFSLIFNGRDLTGWDGKPGSWEVRDGAIWCTGKSEKKNWLIWRGGQPSDFVLRMEFRWDRGNSGVQVRSDDIGDWQIQGYQVEVAKQEVMGLWHHSLLDKESPKREARHLMVEAGESAVIVEDGSRTKTRINDAEAVKAQFQEHAWNTLEIIARGDTLTQKINGVTFSTVTDRDQIESRRKGWIALQDHGKNCEVAFRNLRIKQLDRQRPRSPQQ
ncbi:MAG: family 16 glycoside hydrolase [Verrucomicrobiota bacterium]